MRTTNELRARFSAAAAAAATQISYRGSWSAVHPSLSLDTSFLPTTPPKRTEVEKEGVNNAVAVTGVLHKISLGEEKMEKSAVRSFVLPRTNTF